MFGLISKDKCKNKINSILNLTNSLLNNHNRIKYLDEYQISNIVIEKTYKEISNNLSHIQKDDIKVLVLRLKDYLSAVSVSNKNIDMIDPYTDILWHNFILNTEEYITFCINSFGKIIHHKPYIQDKVLNEEKIKKIALNIKNYNKKYRNNKNVDYSTRQSDDFYINPVFFYILLEDDSSNNTDIDSDDNSSCGSSCSSCGGS